MQTNNDPDTRTPVDVRDMLVVHTAMLRELRLAPAAVRRVEPRDRRQSRAVAEHLDLVGDLLHHHHAGEDELLWPLLHERAPALEAIADAEEQHAGIDAALGRVRSALPAWRDEPTATHRDTLAGHLETLHALLRDHLDLEERALLPICAASLTQAEWDAIGEAGAAALPKSAMPLVFGMFGYEADPVVLTQMLSHAPAPARLLMPLLAPRVYARRARRVHGTTRP